MVGQIFAGGRLPACVRETVNITKDEFEQKLTELYQSAPSVKELIDNLDNLAVYIQSKSGYKEVVPFLSCRQIPFSVNDQEYSLILSPRDALSLLRGFVSGDCTNLVNEFEHYAPDHLLAPGFLNFLVIRNSDNYWIGNVYTVVANTKKGAVLIIDALQLPWQGGIRWLYIKTLPVESLQDSKRISQAAIIALVGDYAAKVNLQEVWLAFTSNFDQLVDYYQDVIYADCPSKSLAQAKEHFRLIGIEDSTSIESFTKMMPTRADKLPRRFIRIWPLEETRSNRLHVAARMADITKLNGLIEEGAKVDGTDASGNTALHYAARSGLKNVVKFLISTNANVNASGEEGKSPLHHAVEHTHERTAQLLISEGADVNAKDAAGDTPLHYAAGSESVTKDIIKLLIGAGADVNAKDTAGNTPMHFIAKSRSPGTGIIELLVAKGADIHVKNDDDQTPVDIAVGQNRREVVKLLVTKGADISIHAAARFGGLAMVENIIQKGTGIDERDASGRTLLHYAVEYGHKDIVELLITKGADVNVKDNDGNTPGHVALGKYNSTILELLIAEGVNVVSIHLSAYQGDFDKVRNYIEKGIDVNTVDSFGATPLHYTARRGHRQVVEFLIARGADVNAKDNQNFTPLHAAVVGKHKDVVALLIENGANINARARWDYTPMYYAAWSRNTEMVELLVEEGADVNAKDEWDWTPLHYMAQHDYYRDMAEFLIAKGANVNAEDRWGWTPLQVAEDKGHTEIVELLRKHGAKE